MKIIDNKKDFYDYLAGINGIDEYVVYDRRGSVSAKKELDGYLKPFNSQMNDGANEWFLRVIAGDKAWPFLISRESKGVFEAELWNQDEQAKGRRGGGWIFNPWDGDTSYHDYYNIKTEKYEPIEPTPEAPVLIEYRATSSGFGWQYIKNPILIGLPIVSKIPAQDIWQAIYDYLLRMKEPEIVDTRSDEEKAESHGFDKKTSFRKDKENGKKRKV